MGESLHVGALTQAEALAKAVEAFRRGQQPRVTAALTHDAVNALRTRLVEAEQEVRELKAANAKLVATAEAYRLRAERAEHACLDAVKRAYGFVAGSWGGR